MDLVAAAQSDVSGRWRDHLAWPFRCGYGGEARDWPMAAWRDWRCVSDALVSAPPGGGSHKKKKTHRRIQRQAVVSVPVQDSTGNTFLGAFALYSYSF
jgi:hypothetical protein